jgi:hypothetical protein
MVVAKGWREEEINGDKVQINGNKVSVKQNEFAPEICCATL